MVNRGKDFPMDLAIDCMDSRRYTFPNLLIYKQVNAVPFVEPHVFPWIAAPNSTLNPRLYLWRTML